MVHWFQKGIFSKRLKVEALALADLIKTSCEELPDLPVKALSSKVCAVYGPLALFTRAGSDCFLAMVIGPMSPCRSKELGVKDLKRNVFRRELWNICSMQLGKQPCPSEKSFVPYKLAVEDSKCPQSCHKMLHGRQALEHIRRPEITNMHFSLPKHFSPPSHSMLPNVFDMSQAMTKPPTYAIAYPTSASQPSQLTQLIQPTLTLRVQTPSEKVQKTFKTNPKHLYLTLKTLKNPQSTPS